MLVLRTLELRLLALLLPLFLALFKSLSSFGGAGGGTMLDPKACSEPDTASCLDSSASAAPIIGAWEVLPLG